MQFILLLALSLIPGILMMYYILKQDSFEKEPIGLVLKAILTGVIGALFAVLIEYFLSGISLFAKGGIPGAILISFIQVAPAEELSKLIPVLYLIWNNPNFNEENDGIVYLCAGALGFAMFENVFYVTTDGFAVGVIRSVTAMPLHCFTGVIMGYYVGLAKFQKDSRIAFKMIAKGFFIAYLVHGIYDTFALSETYLALLLIPLVILIIIVGKSLIKKGHELSKIRWQNKSASQEEILINHEETKLLNTEKNKNFQQAQNKSGKWKIVTGRTLLAVCGITMGLLISSYYYDTKPNESLLELILGGFIIVFIPALIGILLELSYRKRNLEKSK